VVDMGRELEKIAREVAECRKCSLWKTRTNPVPGEGPQDAEVMLVGEAPGRSEDQQGRPFVGAAGKLLSELLAAAGLSREEVYITNVLKCRPPGNRDPLPSEIEACTPFLDRQISHIRPKLICTLGRFSAAYILSRIGVKPRAIASIHGKAFKGTLDYGEATVVAMYHPAAALYKPPLREAMFRDWSRLGSLLRKSRGEEATLESFYT